MLTIAEVESVLKRRGFQCSSAYVPGRQRPKVLRCTHSEAEYPVYLKQSASMNPRSGPVLVLHPEYETELPALLTIDGLICDEPPYYHSSNMLDFPKRRHTGQTQINYGIDLGFEHHDALHELLAWLTGIEAGKSAGNAADKAAASTRSITAATTSTSTRGDSRKVDFTEPLFADDIEAPEAHTETERDALIKARIGQSGFRDALLAQWGGCSVTGCSIPGLLRASHIKPWRAATATERLDPFNGLLLIPNLDLAFDQGWISFDDDGHILISEDLDPESREALDLHSHLRLYQVSHRHRGYLAWHRTHLFRK